MKYLTDMKSMAINNSLSKVNLKFLIIALIGMSISEVHAQYQLRKHSINNGALKMSNNGYEINASIGQPGIGHVQSGDSYTLNSGYWNQNNNLIFKNGLE